MEAKGAGVSGSTIGTFVGICNTVDSRGLLSAEYARLARRRHLRYQHVARYLCFAN